MRVEVLVGKLSRATGILETNQDVCAFMLRVPGREPATYSIEENNLARSGVELVCLPLNEKDNGEFSLVEDSGFPYDIVASYNGDPNNVRMLRSGWFETLERRRLPLDDPRVEVVMACKPNLLMNLRRGATPPYGV